MGIGDREWGMGDGTREEEMYPEARYGSVACTASPSMVKEPDGWDQWSIPRRIWSFHF